MKICIITSDYPPMVGGIASLNREIAACLAESSEIKEIVVYALQQRKNEVRKFSKLTIFSMTSNGLFHFALQVFKIIKNEKNTDVFHAANLYPIGFFVSLFSMIMHKRCAVSIYGTDLLCANVNFITKKLIFCTTRLCGGIAAISRSTARLIINTARVKQDKITVLYYPMPDRQKVKNFEIEAEKNLVSPNNFVVLFVGQLVPRKGCADLIRAIKKTNDPDVKLLVVGSGWELDELQRLASNLGIENRVKFLGKVPNIVPLFRISHVCCMPSYFDREAGDIEGLGIVFLEAQQYGIPVIGTRSGGIPETMEENVTGFLVDEHDSVEIAKKILWYKNNESERKIMGEAGILFVDKKFGWKKVIPQYISFYRSMIG